MTKESLLNALEQNHSVLRAWLNQFSDHQMETTRVFEDWTLNDLLAHVSTWEDVCAGYLGELAAGHPISLLDLPTGAFNARAFEQNRALTLAQVRDQADASYMGVRNMIGHMDETRLDEEMRGPWLGVPDILPLHKIIAIDTWEHYQVHITDLEKMKPKS